MEINSKLSISEIPVAGYERVIEVKEEESSLHAIIALHDTTLGPALGGIRAYPYRSFDDALTDVLRLAKGMTYKAAVAQTGTGGGKSVILMRPDQPKSEALLLAFAEAVNLLEGTYICAEDVGITPIDLMVMRQRTPFIVGLPHFNSSGDPSPFTAFGGFLGVQAVAKQLWGSDSLKNRTIAIQGLGAVGMKLTEQLFWAGAKLIVADINPKQVLHAVRAFSARAVDTKDIYGVTCDIFAPCALGGILNEKTIPLLQCRGIAGLANNQLLTEVDGEQLRRRGIVYAPDFVINAGGLFNVCTELYQDGYNPAIARQNITQIYDSLLTIFNLADEKQLPSSVVANQLAEHNLKQGVGKRTEAVIFHH